MGYVRRGEVGGLDWDTVMGRIGCACKKEGRKSLT